MEYTVVTIEKEYWKYSYYVEADSPEQAEDKVRSGEIEDYSGKDWMWGEYEKIEVSED